MRRLFEGRAHSSNYCNWQLESLLHLGQIVITFRTLLHLGQNVITFRTLLHLGPFITFRPSTILISWKPRSRFDHFTANAKLRLEVNGFRYPS